VAPEDFGDHPKIAGGKPEHLRERRGPVGRRLVRMEKVPEAFSWSTPKLVLYRDDVAALIAIFTKHTKSVEIIIGGYQLDDAAELPSLPMEEVYKLSINARSPYVSLDIAPSGGRLYASASDGPVARGVADEVKEFLNLRRDKWRIVGETAASAAPALCLAAVLGAVVAFASNVPKAGLAGLVALLPLVVFSRWGWREGVERHTHVVLKTRAEAPGFLRRNGDKIALAVISALVGAAIIKLFGHG